MAIDLHRAYRLDPAVTLHPESFGALACHFGNRRLSDPSPLAVTS